MTGRNPQRLARFEMGAAEQPDRPFEASRRDRHPIGNDEAGFHVTRNDILVLCHNYSNRSITSVKPPCFTSTGIRRSPKSGCRPLISCEPIATDNPSLGMLAVG